MLFARLFHPGSSVVHSLSHHPTEPMLLTASLGQIWLWGPTEENEDSTEDVKEKS